MVSSREALDAGISVSTGGWAWRAFYLLFWGWLLARWLNGWFLSSITGIAPGQPFVDPALVEPISDSLAFALTHLPALAHGAWVTIVLTAVAIALGFVIAVPVSVARVYGGYSKWLSLAFTELIRGTPLLAQLFVLYYGLGLSSWIRGLPLVGVGPVPGQAFWVAIVGFTINSAAYQAEYIRSALLSVESGQLTAARGIGLSRFEGIRYVVLPQGLRYAIPAWSNELIYLIKYSSLAAFITVPELFKVAQRIASSNFRYTAIFSLVAVVYLGIIISASNVMDFVDESVAIPGLGQKRSR
ncbi:amino acid ABC transporter permease [Halanaeroarchaeum sulfurireducens]|uniref:Polar amino acid ABC transporter inner membrane protein n=1 Tax=Halanaeroarchaeum sulfurireducens TaxID=1604004 RepID=A0A0F7PCD7_9EURY|nr:amino acid ABC transporter permease [Halanaeroarchaeum sulfurireducens]AKH97294.1 polar amino acid ABC transporter inner membrane protein [Halanaeroarchaeum sulfurireducens]ALG81696.1 polar amino acid ABC transporter inner membrane protein [Halanaeroarchaeum sulfurireducens]